MDLLAKGMNIYEIKMLYNEWEYANIDTVAK